MPSPWQNLTPPGHSAGSPGHGVLGSPARVCTHSRLRTQSCRTPGVVTSRRSLPGGQATPAGDTAAETLSEEGIMMEAWEGMRKINDEDDNNSHLWNT